MTPEERIAWVRTLKPGDRVAVLHRAHKLPPTIETVAKVGRNGRQGKASRFQITLTNGFAFTGRGVTFDWMWRLHPPDDALVEKAKAAAEAHRFDALRAKVLDAVRTADGATLERLELVLELQAAPEEGG